MPVSPRPTGLVSRNCVQHPLERRERGGVALKSPATTVGPACDELLRGIGDARQLRVPAMRLALVVPIGASAWALNTET